jgi:hypothetical protein
MSTATKAIWCDFSIKYPNEGWNLRLRLQGTKLYCLVLWCQGHVLFYAWSALERNRWLVSRKLGQTAVQALLLMKVFDVAKGLSLRSWSRPGCPSGTAVSLSNTSTSDIQSSAAIYCCLIKQRENFTSFLLSFLFTAPELVVLVPRSPYHRLHPAFQFLHQFDRMLRSAYRQWFTFLTSVRGVSNVIVADVDAPCGD